MDTRRLPAKKVLAAVLSGLLPILAVAVPSLDRDLFGATASVEAEHHPSSCVAGHDHTVCSHSGTGRGMPSRITGPGLDSPILDDDRPTGATSHVERFTDDFHASRAPPLS